jgi:hypothetical protein
MSAKRLGTHPDESGTGRILAALPVVCVATEGFAVEKWGKWGTWSGVPEMAQCELCLDSCSTRGGIWVWFVVGKKVTMAPVQERPSYRIQKRVPQRSPRFRLVVAVSFGNRVSAGPATIRGTGHLCGTVPRGGKLPHEAEKDKGKKTTIQPGCP